MTNKQQQELGEGALAIQAGGSVAVRVGMSYSEVKSIAMDAARSTFDQLAGGALIIARERVEEITDAVLKRLVDEFGDGLRHAGDPDFMFALHFVQHRYARSGDADLGKLLVELLVNRTKQPEKSFTQLVLNEALETVPKLTKQHIGVLTGLFLTIHVTRTDLTGIDGLAKYLLSARPMLEASVGASSADLQHLVYCGAAQREAILTSLPAIFLRKYPGLFANGFPATAVDSIRATFPDVESLLAPAISNPGYFRFRWATKRAFQTELRRMRASDASVINLEALFDGYRMNEDQVRGVIEGACPFMAKVFDRWAPSDIRAHSLTTVGMGIAHSNAKSVEPNLADLGVWIH